MDGDQYDFEVCLRYHCTFCSEDSRPRPLPFSGLSGLSSRQEDLLA